MEPKLKLIIGDLVFQVTTLATQLEQAQAKIKELEAAKPE